MLAKTLLAVIAITLLACVNAEYDVAKYCQIVQEGTRLPSLSSCKTYYICQENEEPITEICEDGYAFSKDDQTCIQADSSDCIFDTTNPCNNKDKQFAASSKGCNWYSWCVKNAIYSEATCPVGQIFYAYNGTCIFGNCNTNQQNSDIQNLCEIMPDGRYFGDFKDCSAWYKCTNMNFEGGICNDGLVLDTATAQCLQNDGNMCQRTNNIVKNQASGPPEEDCTDASQVVPDANVCSIYYKCKRDTSTPNSIFKWVQASCNNQYFDVINKRCANINEARTYPCNRCEYKNGNPYFANAVNPTCTTYLTCDNGRQIGTAARPCPSDEFFNEELQMCIGEQALDDYIATRGACQNYTCDSVSRVCTLAGEEETTEPTTDKTDKAESSTEKLPPATS